MTHLTGIEVATSDNSFFNPVTPGSTRESSIAAKSTAIAAWYQIFSWQMGIHFTFGVNTNTVRHGFNSSKSLKDDKDKHYGKIDQFSIFLLYSDADFVTERDKAYPAWSARALVPDFADGRAIRPLFSSIKTLRNILIEFGKLSLDILDRWLILAWFRKDTHHLIQSAHWEILSKITSSLWSN